MSKKDIFLLHEVTAVCLLSHSQCTAISNIDWLQHCSSSQLLPSLLVATDAQPSGLVVWQGVLNHAPADSKGVHVYPVGKGPYTEESENADPSKVLGVAQSVQG
ncbi:hypothetical protein IF1G_11373 [Cordyceps javanica]|uniref:Uncharacterized protein n=1 Tax=Cordyceps javanica TaxID=43265 RepID=A0A545UKH2_9HYPO|nr:hypothetical protein IF1G_11373 [Cordyceps javanica]